MYFCNSNAPVGFHTLLFSVSIPNIYISQNQKNVTIRLKLKKPLIQHFFNDLHTIISQYLKTFYERSLLSGRSGKIGPTIVVMFTFRSEWVMINN